jgi:hypothetical protein
MNNRKQKRLSALVTYCLITLTVIFSVLVCVFLNF